MKRMSVIRLTIPIRGRAIFNSQMLKVLLIMFVVATGASRARADAALLMEEPYGEFGFFNPTGHSAVYLNHVCAESPVKLRTCRQTASGPELFHICDSASARDYSAEQADGWRS